MKRLAQIWRYPVKSIGRERIARASVEKGGKIPFDRHWAVLHEDSAKRLNGDSDALEEWLPKAAFLRGAASPALQAIEGGLESGKLKLRHPDQGEIIVDPSDEDDAASLIVWLAPLWPDDKPPPLKLVRGAEPLTDTRKPYISINSLDSLSALEAEVGQRLGVERWRGNLWIEGAEPFAEADWIDREFTVGGLRMIGRQMIGRCSATAADTETGQPDRDMIRALTEVTGQSDFGIYAEVLSGGDIAEMDELILSPSPEDSE
ncbi:MOSC domain-containing protein [Paracoccus albus]|uniref:MOSC domain-containing protein n=1 Tax=Paracoccus albus TaxID=3017784 RepID=UPI0022F02E8F|nr:MOSC N-terminal beta barrel domain-containing protein [Paracoccus albus]WBU59150.1 MOSC N-terminal beta barrel domain-containing protein [Paracoccus albus]